MPEGDMERVWHSAFVFISVDGPIDELAPYIRSAITAAAPHLPCRFIPSGSGHMMLRFDSKADRDSLARLSPIIHNGASLTVEKAEEADSWFVLEQPWLVALSSKDYPGEHWNPEGIRIGFRKIGTIIEIDPECHHDDNYSALRVVVTRVKPDRFKLDHWIGNPSKGPRGRVLGSTFTISVIRVWSCADQLDDTGSLRPFFPRPPGAPNGGNPHPTSWAR